jgi:cytochrome oxidase assembly protein ShyY1
MSVALRRLRGTNKVSVNQGALAIGVLTGFTAYWNYRFKIKKEFLIGHGLYTFNRPATEMTPTVPILYRWYNMPEEEYNQFYRFTPMFMIGQIDHNKEVLIPTDRKINGKTHKGYDVINPLYTHNGGRLHMEAIALDKKDKITTTERAAIIVNRGWIPAEMKDRKTRPWEKTTRQLTRINGTYMRAKNIHDYTIPNNPNNSEWHNLAPEDLARYWDLPNVNELKNFYFQRMESPDMKYKWPLPPSPEDVVRGYYKWINHEKINKVIYYTLFPVSGLSFWVFFMTL